MHPPILLGFGLGFWEVMLIILIAMLLFSRKLPDLGRAIGRSFSELKKSAKEVTDEQPTETVVPPKQIVGSSTKPGQTLPTFSQPESTAAQNKPN